MHAFDLSRDMGRELLAKQLSEEQMGRFLHRKVRSKRYLWRSPLMTPFLVAHSKCILISVQIKLCHPLWNIEPKRILVLAKSDVFGLSHYSIPFSCYHYPHSYLLKAGTWVSVFHHNRFAKFCNVPFFGNISENGFTSCSTLASLMTLLCLRWDTSSGFLVSWLWHGPG